MARPLRIERVEGFISGCPTPLDLSVVGQEGRWSRVRLETTVGYREILCGSVRVIKVEQTGCSEPCDDVRLTKISAAGSLIRSVR